MPLSFYEQAQYLMAEQLHGLDLEATLPATEIEHLYGHLGRAYELNAEWEKARVVYTAMLTYAQDAGQTVMETTALNHLTALAARAHDLSAADSNYSTGLMH